MSEAEPTRQRRWLLASGWVLICPALEIAQPADYHPEFFLRDVSYGRLPLFDSIAPAFSRRKRISVAAELVYYLFWRLLSNHAGPCGAGISTLIDLPPFASTGCTCSETPRQPKANLGVDTARIRNLGLCCEDRNAPCCLNHRSL